MISTKPQLPPFLLVNIFPCLILVAKIHKTMLNRKGESAHPIFSLTLVRKWLNMNVDVGFCRTLLQN